MEAFEDEHTIIVTQVRYLQTGIEHRLGSRVEGTPHLHALDQWCVGRDHAPLEIVKPLGDRFHPVTSE
jgi:hypothetical protein